MLEQPTKAIDDGQTKPETAGLIVIGTFKAIEFAEDMLVLVLRNPAAGVPDFDAE